MGTFIPAEKICHYPERSRVTWLVAHVCESVSFTGLNISMLLRLHNFKGSSNPAPFACPHREELRRWFIAQELDLFRFRFHKESKDNVKLFLERNDLNYDLVSSVAAMHCCRYKYT